MIEELIHLGIFNKKAVVLSLTAAGLLLLGGLLFIVINRTTTGILWKHGVDKTEIKLTMEKTSFRFYLYEKKDGTQSKLDILTLRKEDEKSLWRYYYDTKLINGHSEIVKAFYPTVENGNMVGHTVWGGSLKKSASKINLRSSSGKIVPAELTFTAEDGTTYFLHDAGNNDSEVEIVD
ncbi:hypothetical protein M3223_09970 [Paenibacillus pasadenensis]|nr:hypothetical protein [Paenibacillus pasadenensis]